MPKCMSFLSRLFFAAAMVFITVAVVDWFVRLFGWTLDFVPYQPGRLFEFATMLLMVVAVVLLRQIRDHMRA
ncbi:MAG: hypothetical protein GY867_08870 [bacterium]|nr:hypothetical protein [bacterium]